MSTWMVQSLYPSLNASTPMPSPFNRGWSFERGPNGVTPRLLHSAGPLQAGVSIRSPYHSLLLLLPPTPTLVGEFDSVPSPTLLGSTILSSGFSASFINPYNKINVPPAHQEGIFIKQMRFSFYFHTQKFQFPYWLYPVFHLDVQNQVQRSPCQTL